MGYAPILDGAEALKEVLQRAGYRTLLEAVAAHTVFLHPETVKQTHGEALFPVVRTRNMAHRGCIIERPSGGEVLLDDNTSPTLAFLWAAQRKQGPDVQFNHLYKGTDESDDYKGDPDTYTALWNICVTPAFLAKLTDVKRHAYVLSALKRRSFDLYGYLPSGEQVPEPTDGYDSLKKKWREHPPPVDNLASVVRDRLRRAPKSRPAKACREIGWCFSGWEPDLTLPNPAGSGASALRGNGCRITSS